MTPPDWIGTGEAADLLGVSARQVQRLARDGVIPHRARWGDQTWYQLDRATVERLARMSHPSQMSQASRSRVPDDKSGE